MTRIFLAATAAIFALTGSAFAHEGTIYEGCDPGATFAAGDITVSGAFTRAMLPQAPSAGGYMSIANTGAEPDRLAGARTEASEVLHIDQMKMEGEVMKMGEVPGGVEIPAGGTATLAPGVLHLMFLGIKTPFKEGECIALTLIFETAGEVPVVLAVGGAAADGPPEHKHE